MEFWTPAVVAAFVSSVILGLGGVIGRIWIIPCRTNENQVRT